MNPRFFYDNRFADGIVVASGTAPGNFAAANIADWRRYTWFKPDVLPATLTVDCGVAKNADYALLIGHDLGSLGATVELRGSTDNFAASDNLVATSTPASDDPVLLTFNTATFRYWRWRLTGATPPSMAIAPAGVALLSPEGIQQPFDPIGRSLNGRANRSENGHPLGRVVDFEEWRGEITLDKVTWAWIRNTFLPAWRAHFRSTPFAFSWEGTAAPGEILLVNAGMKWSAPHYKGSRADLRLELSGVVT